MTDDYTGQDEDFDASIDFDNGADDPDRTVKSSPVPDAPNWEQPQTKREPLRVDMDAANSSYSTSDGFRIPSAATPPPSLNRESAARVRARRRRGRKGGEWAWVVIAGVMIGIVGMASLVMLLVLGSSDDSQAVIPTATSLADRPRPTPVDLRTVADGGVAITGQRITLDNGEEIVLAPWDGNGRLTILMMGIDRRPGESGWNYLTDTMMLISIDPATDEIGILSIPRDLYVPIRGYAEPQRINTPMSLGELREPGYGPTLAMETVQWNLGIRVHEFIVVDFNAFIGLVDAIGGITVTTTDTINDPRYPSMDYGYDPFYLPAGTHDLNGYDALRFARTRHGDSDIHRAGRQQQVLFAIRDKIVDFGMLPRLVFEAPSLYANFDDNVLTSLNLDQMIELAWYFKDIPGGNINTGVIDYSMLQPYTTSSGAQVLIPIRSRIGDLMVGVFGTNYAQ